MKEKIHKPCPECEMTGQISKCCNAPVETNKCKYCNKFTKVNVCMCCCGHGNIDYEIGQEVNLYVFDSSPKELKDYSGYTKRKKRKYYDYYYEQERNLGEYYEAKILSFPNNYQAEIKIKYKRSTFIIGINELEEY